VKGSIPAIRPTGDGVLIKMLPLSPMNDAKTLFIPNGVERRADEEYTAEVLAVGPGRRNLKTGVRVPVEVKVGEKVIVYWSSIRMEPEFLFNGEPCRIVSEQVIRCAISA